jgi:hypothetical protein
MLLICNFLKFITRREVDGDLLHNGIWASQMSTARFEKKFMFMNWRSSSLPISVELIITSLTTIRPETHYILQREI